MHPGTEIPMMVFGTAWKRDQTAIMVEQAIEAGFRGIDTAAQPRHYREDLVGEGIRNVLAKGHIKRQDLYVSLRWYLCTSPSMALNVDPGYAYVARYKPSLRGRLVRISMEYRLIQMHR